MLFMKSKIKADAAIKLQIRIKTNWIELRNNLLYVYADTRDANTLCIQLTNLKQLQNETPFDFYYIIQEILNIFFKSDFFPLKVFLF